MRHLKGFRKNYFSLSAITAYATAKKLNDNEVRSKKSAFICLSIGDEKEEESPPLEELLLQISSYTVGQKPCYCNCFFTLKTKLAISIFKFIPRCPYYSTHFAFRRTGVHPPHFIL
ncbi:MAG: hypothetical protein ACNI3C_02245 [Candidatus Marinarcus sp.]|uniref:hypothetical protein n=1 Tax=Candidatus Marinarcus sp. TaxID=3100987 RepID=UPI003B00FA1E